MATNNSTTLEAQVAALLSNKAVALAARTISGSALVLPKGHKGHIGRNLPWVMVTTAALLEAGKTGVSTPFMAAIAQQLGSGAEGVSYGGNSGHANYLTAQGIPAAAINGRLVYSGPAALQPGMVKALGAAWGKLVAIATATPTATTPNKPATATTAPSKPAKPASKPATTGKATCSVATCNEVASKGSTPPLCKAHGAVRCRCGAHGTSAHTDSCPITTGVATPTASMGNGAVIRTPIDTPTPTDLTTPNEVPNA